MKSNLLALALACLTGCSLLGKPDASASVADGYVALLRACDLYDAGIGPRSHKADMACADLRDVQLVCPEADGGAGGAR
jgi:hypothetical protein